MPPYEGHCSKAITNCLDVGAQFGEALHLGQVAVVGCPAKKLLNLISGLYLLHWLRPGQLKEPHDLVIVARIVERRVAVLVLRVGICSRLQDELHHSRVTMVRRKVKSCTPVLVEGTRIRPAFQEELRHGHVPLARRVEECRNIFLALVRFPGLTAFLRCSVVGALVDVGRRTARLWVRLAQL